jgi:hypothetical protein
MGAGNKKNKRGSIPIISQKTEQLMERTPDNDYGVLSDPDEITTPVITGEEPSPSQQREEQWQELPRDDIHTEQLPLSDSQPSSQPSSQEQPPSSQLSSPSLEPQKKETQLLPSVNSLELKLSTDKNYSKKITLHTFFSYIILALEMERASSASIAHISPDNVQHLIEYMIEHHTETESVRIYLQTLIDTGVVKNLIESVIEFNKDQTEAFNKLITREQIELELAASIQESRVTTTTESPQTPQDSVTSTSTSSGRGNFFKRLFTSCLCCCRRRRPRRDIPQPMRDAELTTTQSETMAEAEARQQPE